MDGKKEKDLIIKAIDGLKTARQQKEQSHIDQEFLQTESASMS